MLNIILFTYLDHGVAVVRAVIAELSAFGEALGADLGRLGRLAVLRPYSKAVFNTPKSL